MGLRSYSFVRRSAVLALALVATCVWTLPADATWSIIILNRKTREVAIGSATCLESFDLRRFLPVVVVGQGAAAAQSQIDTTGNNRMRIFDGLLAGDDPGVILQTLAQNDAGHQNRQYGIVSFDGPPVTFTGSGAGEAKFGLVGSDGPLIYAVQGNVLTGDEVVIEARAALLATPGDVSQKLMAAMEAAAALGGGGRCSCSQAAPTSCGAPPASFTKTAHTGFILISRLGDQQGGCSQSTGCADGSYYLFRRSIGDMFDPDPIIELRSKYDQWRANRADKPDHITSEVLTNVTRFPADGLSETQVTVILRDVEGAQLSGGGQQLSVESVGDDVALISALTDNGDGTHSFTLRSNGAAGAGEWRIVATQINTVAQLYPNLRLVADVPTELHAGVVRVLPEDETEVTLTLNLPTRAGSSYQVLASASGTSPGTPFMSQVIPLNSDRLFNWTLNFPGNASFPDSTGQLDANGRAQARLRLPAFALASFAGGQLDFCALLPNPAGFDVTNVASVDVLQ